MKKILGLLAILFIFSGCSMVPDTPEVDPVLTLGATAPASPSPTNTMAPMAFDIETVKENDKIGDFTVKEVKRADNKVEYLRAEGQLTLEGVFARGDKAEDFDHTLYLKDGEEGNASDFAVFKFQRSAHNALPLDDILMNVDELMLVVKLKDGTFDSEYGNAKIVISNINYTSKAKDLKYYTFDATLESQRSVPEHEYSRQ